MLAAAHPQTLFLTVPSAPRALPGALWWSRDPVDTSLGHNFRAEIDSGREQRGGLWVYWCVGLLDK